MGKVIELLQVMLKFGCVRVMRAGRLLLAVGLSGGIVPALAINKDAPALVVVLHGCTQTAAGYDSGAGWSQLADEAGFVLLFPEQQRAMRATWAAYMLGRTAGDDIAEAAPYYARVREIAHNGAPDPLGLAISSFGCRSVLKVSMSMTRAEMRS